VFHPDRELSPYLGTELSICSRKETSARSFIPVAVGILIGQGKRGSYSTLLLRSL
jgi:hypothetical protein